MSPQQEQLMDASCHAVLPQCFDASVWLSPPTRPRANHDEVHVWRVSLDQLQAPKFLALLDDDERMRAARFRFPEHRKRFAVARGGLRTILGHYLEVERAS